MGWKLTKEELKGLVKEAIDEKRVEEENKENFWEGLASSSGASLFLSLMLFGGALSYRIIQTHGIEHLLGISIIMIVLFSFVFVCSLLFGKNQRLKDEILEETK